MLCPATRGHLGQNWKSSWFHLTFPVVCFKVTLDVSEQKRWNIPA